MMRQRLWTKTTRPKTQGTSEAQRDHVYDLVMREFDLVSSIKDKDEGDMERMQELMSLRYALFADWRLLKSTDERRDEE